MKTYTSHTAKNLVCIYLAIRWRRITESYGLRLIEHYTGYVCLDRIITIIMT